MSSVLSGQAAATPAVNPTLVERLPDSPIDYCSRAMVLWPRLDRERIADAKHDPARVAALVAQRTTLPLGSILELLGVPGADRSSSLRTD